MRLYLINPSNSIVSLVQTKSNSSNKYRIWKPLGLLVLAGLTPPEWDITIIDENINTPDYNSMPRPDLVGITAFTSQADRAYQIADHFRSSGVPVVLGGIHATMCFSEAIERVDSVVKGEAESVWTTVLKDVEKGTLKRFYTGSHEEMTSTPLPRHDLLPTGYQFGSIQTTRGCPLSCSFCSVSAFNGRKYRQRPINDIIEELKIIKEKFILIVDDNLIGTSKNHIKRAKELFRAIIKANVRKKWMCQATINMAYDEELIKLAAKAGCFGVFIGFESPTTEGLMEIKKKFNVQKNRDIKASIRRLQKNGISICGSFIFGLDIDKKGVSRQILDMSLRYELDLLNVLFLTPLPGTELWNKMESEGRILLNNFPKDWSYYTLNHPVMSYKHLSWGDMIDEINACYQGFYSIPNIIRRLLRSIVVSHNFLHTFMILVTNFNYRKNLKNDQKEFKKFDILKGYSIIQRKIAKVSVTG